MLREGRHLHSSGILATTLLTTFNNIKTLGGIVLFCISVVKD